jgi:hypothetical protein
MPTSDPRKASVDLPALTQGIMTLENNSLNPDSNSCLTTFLRCCQRRAVPMPQIRPLPEAGMARHETFGPEFATRDRTQLVTDGDEPYAVIYRQ